MVKLAVALLIGLGVSYAARTISVPRTSLSAASLQRLQTPIPATAEIGPVQPMSAPKIQPLDLGNANARAAASELHRLDEQGISGSWAFPRNRPS
jgi:hypothetical protein